MCVSNYELFLKQCKVNILILLLHAQGISYIPYSESLAGQKFGKFICFEHLVKKSLVKKSLVNE